MTDRDDEVTTDVDPEWIEAIRAETAGTTPQGPPSPDADDAPDADRADWFDTELQWDAEATVGVTSGLLDRIRAEIDPHPTPPVADHDAVDASVPAPAIIEPDPVAAPPPPAMPTPPIAPLDPPLPAPAPVSAPLPVTPAEDAASATVRWEPRQRLAMSAPVKESTAIIDDSRHSGLDRTKIIIAVIVAITVVLVVWLVSRSGGDGGDTPPPDGTAPATSVAGAPPAPDGDEGTG